MLVISSSANSSAITPSSQMDHRWLLPAVGLALIIFLLNILTATRSPTVWNDEVWFADPAVHYLQGHGFTSSAWPGVTDQTPFCSNAPLYSLLLIGWLKVWGISPLAVRSFNFVLAPLGALIAVEAARRHGLIHRRLGAMVILVLLLTGQEVVFAYRSGRYDTLCLFIAELMLLVFTARSQWFRWAIIFFLGIVWPLAALPTAAFAFASALIIIALTGFRWIVELLLVGIGCLIGLAVFFAIILHFHNIEGFRANLQFAHIPTTLAGRLHNIVAGIRVDYSSLWLAFVVIVLALVYWKVRNIRRLAVAGVLAAILIPTIVASSSAFPNYYSWMKFFPLVLCGAAILERLPVTPIQRAIAACLIFLSGFGLPARLLLTVREWRARDYKPLEAFVAEHISKNDVVYADFAPYYPLVKNANRVYLITYSSMPADEKAKVNVLLVRPEDVFKSEEFIPDHWRTVGSYSSMNPHVSRTFGSQLYNLVLLRRSSN